MRILLVAATKQEINTSLFTSKSVLITGGTGSFGNLFVETVLKKYKPKKIIIYSTNTTLGWL